MAEQEDTEQAVKNPQEEQGEFGIQKIYVKDISFETPHSPQIFQEQWQPSVNMDVSNSATALSNQLFEVSLAVTITVSFEEKTVYLAEVHQAGVFHIDGFSPELLNRMLATVCPNILFPFARELIADLATRGGFPQLLLAPMNFDALYEQHLEKARQEASSEETTTH